MNGLLTMLCATCLMTLSGCADARREPAPVAATAAGSSGWTTSTPLRVNSEPTAVKEGPAPLVYLVETAATIRVRDASANRDLAQAVVPGRRMVRVDARSGVVYGGDTLVRGPLPADHHYVIFVQLPGENVARQGTFQLQPRREQ